MEARLETWLWLADCLGACAPHSRDLLDEYPNPEELVAERFRTDLSAFLAPAQLSMLQQKEPEDYLGRVRQCAELGIGIVTPEDVGYPFLLRTIDTMPPVLYYRGDITLANRCLLFGFVGTRRPSAYGIEAAKAIAEPLAKAGVVLVSGLANGLDSESHKAALQQGAPTVACIAFGHDFCYPASNKTLKNLIEKTGLVLSEYPPGTEIQKPFFLHRNRLIAGISRGICVAEARKVSGTMNTVNAALAFNRDVFAVPGSIFSPLSEGTNAMLRDGATAVTCANEVLEHYGITPQESMPKSSAAQPLSETAKKVQKVLTVQPKSLAALCEEVKIPPHEIMAALTELELAGISRQQAGRQFVLKI